MVRTRNAAWQAPLPDGPPVDAHRAGGHPLADEHAVLLNEVRIRERAARTALGQGRWPGREVAGLVAYLRYEVLDQAVTEERLLLPRVGQGLADPRVHALTDDHVQLRDLTDRLSITATSDDASDPGALLELLDDLDGLLVRHMRTEEALLSPEISVGVESLRHPFRCHLWFPMTEGPDVDLDALPREFAHRAALERFSRLRSGERLQVTSRCDLDGLWNLLSSGHPGEYGWIYLEEGAPRWRAEVIRRAPE